MARSRSGSRLALLAPALVGVWLISLGTVIGQEENVPEVVRTLLDEGDRHRQAGRVEEAIERYEEARRLAPAVVAPYVALGALYHGQGSLEKALEAFAAGLEQAPEHPNLLFNAAVVALQLERADEALAHADRALRGDARNAQLHALKSAALRALGRPGEALESQQAAARLAPADPQSHYRLANLLYELGRKDEAIDAYRQAVRRDKGYLLAYYNLGAVLFELGRYEEALAAYLVALEPVQKAFAAGEPVDASHARAYLNLGAIHTQRGEREAALDAYGKALRLDPVLSGALYNQGFLLYETGRFDEAEKAYRRALELEPSLPLAYLHLGRIAARRGDLEETVDWLERGLERLTGDERREALFLLAETRRSLGRTDGAEAAYRAVLDGDPDHVEALVALARLRRAGGDTAAASELLERARGLAPRHAGAALELAELARAAGDREREKALYEGILAGAGDRPGLWPVRLNLARVLVELGDHAAARRAFEPLVARLPQLGSQGLAPRDGQALATAHALLLAAEGKLEEARRRLREVSPAFAPAGEALAVLDALAGDPAAGDLVAPEGEPGAVPQANAGQSLWLAGRAEEAREHLEAAAKSLPGHPGVRLALGEIALAGGDASRALDHLEAAAARCEGGEPRPELPPSRALRVVVGGSPRFCERARERLGAALVAAALADLERARGDGEAAQSARRRAERALALPLAAEGKAAAYLVRGTVQLLAGSHAGARADLERSLDGLPRELRAVAQNNLGVARYRLGDVDGARAQLATAAAVEADLNLAILLDDHGGDPERALELYERYLERGGRRRADAEAWIERLRKVYR